MTTTLTLGDMTFAGFGVPEKIPGGGDHRVAVHQLPDGVRIVDAMGADDAELKWSGIFFGDANTSATDQAKYLDRLRKTGEQISLSWDVYSYTVIVSSLEWDFERFYQIPYEITCTVIEDKTNPGTSQQSQTSVGDLVGGDFTAGMVSATALNMTIPSGQIAPFSGATSSSAATSSSSDIIWTDPQNENLTPGQ